MFDVRIILVYVDATSNVTSEVDIDLEIILVYVDATSNVTSEVDIDLERWILDIIHLEWSDVISQIHLSM